MGRSAFRSAWRRITARCDSPFASAVRMNSRDSTSSMLARVMRATIARGIVASARVGRIRWRSASTSTRQFPCRAAATMTKFVHGTKAAPVSRRKPVGRTRRVTPKNHASMTPSQKMGIETPMSAPSRARLSTTELRHTAEATPIGMPRPTATKIAAVASSTVAGKRLTAAPGADLRALLDRHGVEVLGAGRVGDVPLHPLREGERRPVVRDEEPSDIVVQHLLGLAIELRPLRLTRQRLRAEQDLGERFVRVEAIARDARLAEEVAQEVVRVPVVTGPAEHVERELPVLALVQVHRPLGGLELGLDPDLREIRGRSEEHTSELQSRLHLVCRLLLEKKKKIR